MKLKKIFIAFLATSLVLFAVNAENSNHWDFSVTTDFGYYPDSKTIINNSSTHFAPITGVFSGVEGRVTGNANYVIATPLGENWLLNSANIVLGTSIELTPVSIKPGVSVTFTPLPFLVFSAGAQSGTGWTIAGLKGMASYDASNDEYNSLSMFKNWFLKWWVQGTFQFDTGAIFPGDWTHVVMQYSYQVYYEGLSGMDNQDVWMWQTSGNKVNGLRNYQNLILAYQMPLKLYRVGVLAELDGYYKDDVYKNPNYNGSFKEISISPLLQFKFNDKNTLSALINFSSRRSFTTDVVANTNVFNDFASREWYFKRIALSWTHNF